MGLYTLKTFDTLGCASLCDQANGCQAFNMYIERDPTVAPDAVDCPNPPSLTNFKCTLWGAPVVAEQVQNKGQWRASFQVVITSSNGMSFPPQRILSWMDLNHEQVTTRLAHRTQLLASPALPRWEELSTHLLTTARTPT